MNATSLDGKGRALQAGLMASGMVVCVDIGERPPLRNITIKKNISFWTFL